MFSDLYGKKAAALYTQAGDYQKTARFYYKKAEDTYYQVLFEATLRTVTMQSARCSRARLACTQNCCCVSGPAGLRCVAGAVPRAIVVFACNGHSRRVFSLLTPSATVPGQQLGRVRRLAPRPRPVGLLLFPCVARPASCSQRNCVAAPRQQHMLRAPAALFASVPLSNVAPELRVSWLQSGRAAAVVSRHAW